jgi:hypothetical protein
VSKDAPGGHTVIARVYTDSEANVVRSLLESYGIPVSVASDLAHTVYPITVDGLGEIRISVPDDLREEALHILRTHRARDGGQDE